MWKPLGTEATAPGKQGDRPSRRGQGWPHESGALGQGLETLIQGPDNKNKDKNSKWVCGTCGREGTGPSAKG